MTIHKRIDWKKEELSLSIDYPNNIDKDKKYSVVIICHGLIGSKVGVDRLFVKTGQHLIEENFIVYRFDYAGCGESSGEYGSYGLTELIEQTNRVIDYVYENEKIKNLTLIGHSLGGATALLTAVNSRRIDNIIQWAAVGNPYKDLYRIFGKEKMIALGQQPSVDFYGYSFYDYYFQSMQQYQPLEKVNHFNGDVLLLHGTGDEDIDYHYLDQYCTNYQKRQTGSVTAHLIENANHTFSTGEHFHKLIGHTKDWLINHT